jgi:tetratricopeptide (TPR) repeat protein
MQFPERRVRNTTFAMFFATALIASVTAIAQERQYATQLSSDPKVNFGICTGASLDGPNARPPLTPRFDTEGHKLTIAACSAALGLSNLTEWGRAHVYASRGLAHFYIASGIYRELPMHPDDSFTLDDVAAQAVMKQRASLLEEVRTIRARAKADLQNAEGLVRGKRNVMLPSRQEQMINLLSEYVGPMSFEFQNLDSPVRPLRPYAERRLPNATRACERTAFEDNAAQVRDACGVLIAEPVAGDALRKAYTQRAAARQKLKDFPSARADVEQALRMNPDDLRTLSLSADLYLAARDPGRALKDLQRIAVLDPDQKVISTGERIANIHYPSCLNAAAAPGAPAMPEPCRQALAALGNSNLRINVLLGLGATKLRGGANADAEAAFDQAVNITPDRATFALYARGIARERLGRKTEAEADFALAVNRDPQIAQRVAQSNLKIVR